MATTSFGATKNLLKDSSIVDNDSSIIIGI
jgi:hypothetical protein